MFGLKRVVVELSRLGWMVEEHLDDAGEEMEYSLRNKAWLSAC